MRVLLDTHSFIWFIAGDPKLSDPARQAIQNEENDVLLSAASIWEMAIKTSLGKLALAQPFDQLIPAQLELNAIEVLPVEAAHAIRVATLPYHHRDPFDRLLAAQSLEEDLPIVSVDIVLDSYGVKRIW